MRRILEDALDGSIRHLTRFFLPFFENLTVIILFGKALESTLFVQGFVFLFVDHSAHFLFSFIPLDFFPSSWLLTFENRG